MYPKAVYEVHQKFLHVLEAEQDKKRYTLADISLT